MTVVDLDSIRSASATILRFADRPRTTSWQELSCALLTLRDADLAPGRLQHAVADLTAAHADRDDAALLDALRELARLMHLPCPIAAETAEQLRFDV